MKAKNSNKILLCILALTISIPLLVAIVLRHQVRTGHFQIERHIRQEDPSLRSRGPLDDVKAIKLIGPRHDRISTDTFCTVFTHGSQNSYTLIKESREDSVQIQRLGDTLVFAYYKDTTKGMNDFRSFHHIRLVLELPGNIPVLADNCKLGFASWNTDTLDGIYTAPGFIYLKDGAILEMGSENLRYVLKRDTILPKGQIIFVRDSSQASKNKFDSTFAPMTGFHIVANNSTVRFIQPLAFKNFQLEMENSSSLELSHPFKTGQLSGQLGADTEIKGGVRGLRSIKALIKD